MGNREDLLAGALACLKTKGWARTTVRDIAAAAGVNHAAIGYHFGSREALLIEAFTQALDTWGTQTEAAVRAASAAGAGPREQYEEFWRQVIESYAASRWLWLATVEAAVQAEHSPKVRELMAASLRQARSGLAAGLLGVPEDTLDGPTERALGSVQLGHVDKQGGNNGSWNSSHPSRGCSQPNLVATGGAGLLYCFAAN